MGPRHTVLCMTLVCVRVEITLSVGINTQGRGALVSAQTAVRLYQGENGKENFVELVFIG